MLNDQSKLIVTSWNCSICGGSTILCNVCFGGLFPRWAKVTKAELRCSDRFFPRWAKTTGATIDDPMTASLNANDQFNLTEL